MQPDVVDLQQFYEGHLGNMVRHMIRRRIRAVWPSTRGMRVLGLGYATPYLRQFRDEAERVAAFMLAGQGVHRWPADAGGGVALVDDTELPLEDAMVDRILLVHALEHAGHAQAMLGEAWRVLAADGRLLMVVPNRRGIWARFERTPFGAGRPYSARQIDKLLRSNMFKPLRTQGALYFPPSRRPVFLKAAGAFEKVFPRFKVNAFAGALLIEASKQVYAMSDRGAYVVKARRRRPRTAVPLGASTVAGVRGTRGRVIDAVLRPAQHEKALPSK